MAVEDCRVTRQVAIEPTHAQRRKLKMLASAYNYVWNRAVAYLNKVARDDIEGQRVYAERKTADIAAVRAEYAKKALAVAVMSSGNILHGANVSSAP